MGNGTSLTTSGVGSTGQYNVARTGSHTRPHLAERITTRPPASLLAPASRTTGSHVESPPSPHTHHHQEHRLTTTVRASFSTATSATVMPELRLSSPHPGGRIGNANTTNSLSSRDDDIGASGRWNSSSGHHDEMAQGANAAHSENAFDYHA